MELLRFITAGSVDDGKSTLIGRMLYDTGSVLQDQLEAIQRSSEKLGFLNLALLTDGLKAEREQGITIDVAYKYFSTDKRKFIIADAPGHIQYTRNMITGASNSNLAIILVDARKGVIEQTYRHSYIASLVKIPHIVVCINKMDLVDYSEEIFNRIKEEFNSFAARLDIKDIEFIPVSALNGDNVVEHSKNMPWYEGRSLLHHLENVHIESDYDFVEGRFPVQFVIRPQSGEYKDFRGYAGQIAGGIFRKGDSIIVQPSGFGSKIKAIHFSGREIEEAFPPMSVTITLEDDIDVSRGDMIIQKENQPQKEQDITAYICWMDTGKIGENSRFILQHTSNRVKCILKTIAHKININTFEEVQNDKELHLNDIAKVQIRTASPVMYDEYRINRETGSFILIDEATNLTAAAGVITGKGI
ncbi:MAG: 50S ribosome-binding GTPase [Leptospiraceae bacterium]|nr:50S ribosome-binding GTPase [Leptospiraceae bacterium]MCP5503199.1 50S ribosome-binding GTPase [Leptospiraceae bacterium]